jgi:hypothetical protein
MDERLPQFLHRPVQILWFDSDEFILVLSTIFVAAIVGGVIGWALIGPSPFHALEALETARLPRASGLALGAGLPALLPGSDPDPLLRVRRAMAFFPSKPRTGAQSDPLLGKPASFGIHRYLQGSANLFEETACSNSRLSACSA